MREMKYSGIEWIGQIPLEWKIDKIKYHLKRNEPKNHGNAMVLSVYRDYGVIPKDSRDDNHNVTSEDTSKYKYVKKGQLVINKMKAWQGSLAVSDYNGIVSPAYFIYDFTDEEYNHKYFHYLVRSCYKEEFKRISGGIREGQWDLSPEAFANTLVLLPPLVEQKYIANHLDTQCSEIGATAEDIQKEISLLEDYKKSVITEAVTKGLNSDAEMKDSGIAWIGDIPKDWDLLKIGYVTKEISDIDHYMPSDSDDIDKVPYVMIGDLKENISQIDFESCKYISKKVYRALSIKSKPEKENVIFARYATIGTVCFVDSEKQLLVSYACLTVKANELIKGRFLFYYFKSNAFLEEVSQYVKSNTQGNIGKESLVRAKIVVPKLKEQTQIISYLDSKCSEIDAIIADKKRQLDILTEYKKSLIYEYVTGKKEVPINE